MTDANPPADEIINEPDGSGDGSRMEDNLKSKSTWLRLVFMIVFSAIANLTLVIAGFIVVIGFLFVLFTGEVNEKVKQAGAVIAAYLSEIISYLTFNSDTKPFPFDGELPKS
ncbi:MAG: DUF4389 domain-containing protein [Pseudomonadota bacterium]